MGKKQHSGRGAGINPASRFDKLSFSDDDHFEPGPDDEGEPLKTKFIRVHPKTIVNTVDSPDVRMMYSANPYQGCEHGCAYCFARPTHNYWGYSAGLDFEQKVLYKANAAELLIKKLEHKSWQGDTISFSGNTDCYQPVEKKLEITRSLLQVCNDYNNPVGIITKNALISRDIDILSSMAARHLVHVILTINTVDESLRRKMEPRTASSAKRFETIRQLTAAGIPVALMVSPIIPSLNDYDILKVMERAAEAGALSASYIIVRLNGDVATVFTTWLQRTYPDKAERVLRQIRQMHDGRLSDSRFGKRMRGEGAFAEMIKAQFSLGKNKYFQGREMPALDHSLFRRPYGQQSLF